MLTGILYNHPSPEAPPPDDPFPQVPFPDEAAPEALSLDREAAPEAPLSENTKATGGNILIVDDTPDNLLFLSTLLTEAGYAVRKVISGQMAVSAAQIEVPDLVLLDIMMPGMGGYEVCQQLKASEKTRSVPIVFLSALDEELDKVQAFQVGGVDYITKPFQVVEVLARIETHLKIGRLQAQLQQQNARLQQEINSRTAAESAVQRLNQGIEAKIQERHALLISRNLELRQQTAKLQQALTEQRQQYLHNTQRQLVLAKQLRTSIAAMRTEAQHRRETTTLRSQQDTRLLEIEETTRQMIELLEQSS